jgi:hypothetical protein
MKLFLKISFFMFVMFLAPNLFAQEKESQNNGFPSYYTTEMFQWSYDYFGGLNLNYQNESSTITFGVKDSMREAFASYDETNKKIRSFKTKTIFGNILFWGGLTALVSTPYIIALGGVNDYGMMRPGIEYIALGTMGGGLVSLVVGSILYDLGVEDIFDAVNMYNRNKINEYQTR